MIQLQSDLDPGTWTKYAEFLLDFAAVVLVSTDIVTDVLVIHEFYIAGKMTVFYVGVGILCCAQISYLMLFFLYFLKGGDIFKTRYHWVKVFFTMLLVAPFGQLVPLFIWVDSHRIPCIDNILDSLGWYKGDNESEMQAGQDPLMFWIQSKIRKHAGFIIESVIEALPQSILQIVALMVYKHVTPLSLYSIITSMTSVAVRGIMVSYSLSRATFIFNCTCFAADIFNIFSCFSWAFWDSDIIFPWTDTFWRFVQPRDIYGQIWFNQMLCMAVIFCTIIALYLLTISFLVLPDLLKKCNCRFWEHQNGDNSCIGQVLETIFFVFIIMPAAFAFILTAGGTGIAVLLMVCQIFKLWPWCFVFTTFESDHMSKAATFYSPWINWLLSSPTSYDLERRIGISFRNLARDNCLSYRLFNGLALTGSRELRREALSAWVLKVPFDKLTCRVLRRDVLGMRSNTWQICCGMPKKCSRSASQNAGFASVRQARGVREDQWVWEQYFVYGYNRMFSGLILYVLLPSHIISLLFNLIYPFLAFSKVGLDAQYIQIVLTSIYFLLLGIALIFSPAMWRYRRLITYVPIMAIDFRIYLTRTRNLMKRAFKSIKEEYTMDLGQIYIEQILHHFFQHMAPLMIELLGPQRNLAVDQEFFFLSDPQLYRDPNGLTIYELNYVPSIKGKANNTKEVDLHSVNCGLMTPLLDRYS